MPLGHRVTSPQESLCAVLRTGPPGLPVSSALVTGAKAAVELTHPMGIAIRVGLNPIIRVNGDLPSPAASLQCG